MTTEEMIEQFRNTPPSEWDVLFQSLEGGSSEVITLQRDADALAQFAAQLSGYLSARGASSCGDHGHEDALEEGHRVLKEVRKGLGYTQP